ncbi:MAG: hypothetical protein GY694_21050 [Gammaproteobacteria bacterium]|nr:hypothetical protein [Gammaproteobacteria bacterium]
MFLANSCLAMASLTFSAISGITLLLFPGIGDDFDTLGKSFEHIKRQQLARNMKEIGEKKKKKKLSSFKTQ